MYLYEAPLFMSLLGFMMGITLSNFNMYGIMLLLRAGLNILVRNPSPSGPKRFRCLMFSLSGPCELFLNLFYCLLDLSCGECNVISL